MPPRMHQGTSKVKRRSLLISAAVAAVLGVGVLGGSVALGSNSSPSAIKVGEWPLPGADLQNTRKVPGPITSSNVGNLKVAWKLPIRSVGSFGDYSSTPIVVGGIVYTQDINSNVYAINLQSGKLKWFKKYNKPDEGPNGVNVINGVVYGATGDSAFALQASTGEQIWIKKLTRNANEGIDMAPGYNNGTVYVSTVPGNSKGFYEGNGQAILWALNAKSGATVWKWDEVPTDIWSKAHTNINSGGGQWDAPSFDTAGNVYVGVSNPAPWPGTAKYPFASSRPGKNLYSDSIVKLNAKTGKLMWYYQVTPHDLYDWDVENSPIVTTANGKGVVIDAGKGGIVVAVDENTGKLLWRTPVGKHNGHDRDGDLTLAQAKAKIKFPVQICPGALGGVESQLASNGTNVFVAANNLCEKFTNGTESGLKFPAFTSGTGDFVALDQATGKVAWDHKFAHSPYGAASITNDVVFTTTFDGTVWALSTKTGKALWHAKMPAATNAPVTIAGNTVISAGSFPQSKKEKPTIVAYRLP